MFEIEYTLPLDDVEKLTQKTTGDLVAYKKEKDLLQNEQVEIVKSNYENVAEEDWEEIPPGLSKGKVKNYNVKNLISMGAYGFHVNGDGELKVELPIDNVGTLPVVSDIELEDKGEFITFEAFGDMSFYDAVRITFSKGTLSREYVISGNSGEIFKSPDMEDGLYTYTFTGYSLDLKSFSEPSKPRDVELIRLR